MNTTNNDWCAICDGFGLRWRNGRPDPKLVCKECNGTGGHSFKPQDVCKEIGMSYRQFLYNTKKGLFGKYIVSKGSGCPIKISPALRSVLFDFWYIVKQLQPITTNKHVNDNLLKDIFNYLINNRDAWWIIFRLDDGKVSISRSDRRDNYIMIFFDSV